MVYILHWFKYRLSVSKFFLYWFMETQYRIGYRLYRQYKSEYQILKKSVIGSALLFLLENSKLI